MGKRKKGRCVKRNVGIVAETEPEELKSAPHSFVFHRGIVGSSILDLIKDFRRVMEPFTASSLHVRKKCAIKDYVAVAGMFNVTHFIIFTQTQLGVNMKLARSPQGPTITFKVQNYTLCRDVIAAQKKALVFEKQFEHSPLIVLNGFSGEGEHLKLMTSMFQNLFPTINVMKVDLASIRRCVLLNYDPESKLIDFRHYGIKVVPVGISRSVKKVVQHKVPKLGRYADVSEYLTNPLHLSESEAEDDPMSHVVLPQKLSSRGNIASATSAIRVSELGPRLTLQLIKIEKGLMNGEVLHHELVKKSKAEMKLIRKSREQKQLMKEKRRKVQEENLKKKDKLKKLKEKTSKGEASKVTWKQHPEYVNKNDASDDDDVEWYKKEVGEVPEKELFDSSRGSVKRTKNPPFIQKKKKKLESTSPKFNKLQHSLKSKNKDSFRKNKVFGSKINKTKKFK